MSRTEDQRVLRKPTRNWSLNRLTADLTWSDPRMILFTGLTKGLNTLLIVPVINRLIAFTTVVTNGYSMLIHECSHLLL